MTVQQEILKDFRRPTRAARMYFERNFERGRCVWVNPDYRWWTKLFGIFRETMFSQSDPFSIMENFMDPEI